ncbi:IS1096 element passenger TnpR family protein [Citricoccus muralis]|uniref:Plasmid pRiA4b Orf3-like domain-containing protein n=1 Tax=Citricoccus muralis TaxID=169134 RepID=A0ABY8H5E2_9MICC|nr:hypothetical protein [Citricoccus muralis]WFP16356.1 hypothetical protein P8192_13395 [Citricoccus muralis]
MTTGDEREPWEAELDDELLPEPVPAETVRTVQLATTGMERPLTVRVRLDVSLPAEHVMYVLWAAAGLEPQPAALLTREGKDPVCFGVAAAWRETSNEDAVHDLNGLQFAQLFRRDTELYAEIDPARGWRARITLDTHLDDDADGEPGSPVRVRVEPFGIPLFHSAAEIDVLLKASDGEQLTPLEQQVLLHLEEPLRLPFAQIAQSRALGTLAAVTHGLVPGAADLLPVLHAEYPLTTVALEVFCFVSEQPVSATATGRLPVAELRRLAAESPWIRELQGEPDNVDDVGRDPDDDDAPVLRAGDLPLVDEAWAALRDTGLVRIPERRAVVADHCEHLVGASHEWRRFWVETAVLAWMLRSGYVAGYAPDGSPVDRVSPTIAYESAQDYADSLISAAATSPEEVLRQLMEENTVDEEERDDVEHIEFTIELEGLHETVSRRMSVPLEANLHSAVETILVMFGWELTHLWQLDVADRSQLVAHSSEGIAEDSDGPLAAEMHVGDVLRADGPALLLTYDYGDNWEMRISPVGTRVAGEEAELLSVDGDCPPEDAGGPGGYQQKVLALEDPEQFAQDYPDYESEEIHHLAGWLRTMREQLTTPEPGYYELVDHPLPYP